MTMTVALVAATLAITAVLAVCVVILRCKHLDLWLSSYLRACWRGRPPVAGVTDIIVCIADHFEPAWNHAGALRQRHRVSRWVRNYPVFADRHRDANGVPVQWTFFYPEEEYAYEHLQCLGALCRNGYGDVEIHLHHHDDTSDGVRQKLLRFANLLATRHQLLRRSPVTGQVQYAFIHGNWALDNSAPNGAWCGVDDELRVLRETGCYADFTFPSAPSDTQPRQINSIYYATDDPATPKSHDTGTLVRTGTPPSGDLLLIQGPLTLDWHSRSRGVFPRIENGELSGDNPPSPHRADVWVRQHVHVEGCPNWVFVKLHTHGANEKNTRILHGPEMDRTLAHFELAYNDGVRYRLHYVTAWEMFNIVRAAEAGLRGSPHQYRRLTEDRTANARVG